MEEDTSGISGISPLEDPSLAVGGVGDGGGEEGELADSQEWRKLKISYDPPSSADGRGERSFHV